ncbi:LamB/YcsF family protein [Kineosporia sp. A_224]|uniref:LamB/YcsF family protein n=1 Tax=Kineosporia sp. A_224 TaxID=1962180 RepID=UPI000B4AB577|nr:5-oxoprolinase subunit PxpA [Kineosporia sp. A_224]
MRIDLNADVGESFGRWTLGDDDALLEVVTSANVACGFHAGDPATLRRTCATAARHGVALGAQVSYRDLAGFGRRFVDVAPADLRDDVAYQVGGLAALAAAAGVPLAYVKPHGALYNAVVHHEAQAAAVVEAVAELSAGPLARAWGGPLAVLGLPGSALLRHAADAGLRVVAEAFADRGYTPAGTLVPRAEPGALVTDPAEVAARAVRMAVDHEVVAVDGSVVAVDPGSLCVHGDSPDAVGLARAVRTALAAAGVDVRSFATP